MNGSIGELCTQTLAKGEASDWNHRRDSSGRWIDIPRLLFRGNFGGEKKMPQNCRPESNNNVPIRCVCHLPPVCEILFRRNALQRKWTKPRKMFPKTFILGYILVLERNQIKTLQQVICLMGFLFFYLKEDHFHIMIMLEMQIRSRFHGPYTLSLKQASASSTRHFVTLHYNWMFIHPILFNDSLTHTFIQDNNNIKWS